jgi:hypothetical protein
MADRSGGSGTQQPSRANREFLEDHHREVASRLACLFERAQLRQRVTMSYDPGRVGQRPGTAGTEVSDSAADARRRLARLAAGLPRECWGVLVDVHVYDKGLQQIETERHWPRRSAKLVLRIGLDHAAVLLGIDPNAVGLDRAAQRTWLPERPPMFSPAEN